MRLSPSSPLDGGPPQSGPPSWCETARTLPATTLTHTKRLHRCRAPPAHHRDKRDGASTEHESRPTWGILRRANPQTHVACNPGDRPSPTCCPPIRSRPWAAPTTARQTARRQGVRLQPPAPAATLPEHHPRASPARTSSPPNAWAVTDGPWNGLLHGKPCAAACTAATNARPSASSPSPASRPRSSATGVWAREPVQTAPRKPGSVPSK